MKKFFTIVITICLIVCLAGCGSSDNVTTIHDGRFCQIPNEEYLYYDIETNVVYFIRSYAMSPYYADNGFPYVYNTESNILEKINIINEMIKW